MPPSALVKPSVGEATKKVSFADLVIDWIAYFAANMGSGSGGGSGSSVPNGDFELDGDTDGIPDGWDLTEYTAGAFALDTTTPAQGATAVKFTSPGASGGGDLQVTDFFSVSPQRMLEIDFLTWASVAGIHNLVEVRWYSTALEANYIETTTIYDSVANPTSPTRFIGLATPPSTARFAKLKVVGAKNDNATAGIAYFDGVSVTEGFQGLSYANIAEVVAADPTHSDTGTFTLPLPVLSAKGMARITFCAEGKRVGAATGAMSFTLGAYASNTITGIDDAAYAKQGPFVITYMGTGGAVTLTMTLVEETESGTDTANGRMVDEPVCIEVLTP